jgi:hypothetical protein
MDLHEEIAQLAERNMGLIRQQFADRYRALIGVFPERREEFRNALGRVEAGGGMPVADLLDAFR